VPWLLAVSIFLAAILNNGSVTAAELEQLLDAKARAQYAYYAGSASDLRSARDAMQRLTDDPVWDDLAYYYIAYANYRLAQLFMESDKNTARERLDDCVDMAKPATKSKDLAAEAFALQSACFGLKSAVQPLKAMFFGPNAGRKIRKALNLSPANPRVVLLDAVNDYFRPRFYGGNKDRAFEKFNKAANLFDEDQAIREGYPDWGQAEVYAYLGNYYLEREDAIRARNAFERALLIAPDYEWVRDMLPRLASLQNGQ